MRGKHYSPLRYIVMKITLNMSKASIQTYTNLQIKNKNVIYVQLKNWYPQYLALTRLERNLLNNSSRLHGNQTKVSCERSQVYKGVARDKTI